MSEGEKKAIEMLEKFITEHKLFNIKQTDNLEDNIEILLNLYDVIKSQNVFQKEYIEELQKELQQEKEKNKELYEIKYVASTFINRPLSQFSIGEFRYQVNNSISKDKIRDKIEELIKKGGQLTEDERQRETQFYQGKLKALEELLEE